MNKIKGKKTIKDFFSEKKNSKLRENLSGLKLRGGDLKLKGA